MALLTPDLGLVFWMLLCFGIVFGILAKFGFPIITRSVDERREYIENSLKAADQANARLESIAQEAEKMIRDAEAHQADILKKAVAEGEHIIQNSRDKAQQESDKQLAAAKAQIEAQKQKALGQIRTEVAMLSVDIAQKVLRSKLEEEGSQHTLISHLLDEMEQKSKS